jgi:hypothetical protein
MNFLQLKRKFAGLSGRYDLLNEDPSETIDFFINSGSEFLDRLSETQKTWATHYRYIAQGEWTVQFPRCRAVKEVWIASTTARWQLEKMKLQDLLAGYMSELIANQSQGDPLYYSPYLTRTIDTLPVGSASYIDTIVDQGNIYNAVIILPSPDKQLLVEIKGFFLSEEMTVDVDENFWAAVHPSLLLKAALHEMEVFNQNQDKVTAWEKVITLELDGINKDLIEEEISEVSEMDGESRSVYV